MKSDPLDALAFKPELAFKPIEISRRPYRKTTVRLPGGRTFIRTMRNLGKARMFSVRCATNADLDRISDMTPKQRGEKLLSK